MYLFLIKDFDSVFVKGRYEPNPESSFYFNDGLEVPCGELLENELDETKRENRPITEDSEYVVMSSNQIRLRYLIEIKNKEE